MLWKPATPVYPKLIQEAPEGLTKTEADEMRKKGKNLLPICKLVESGKAFLLDDTKLSPDSLLKRVEDFEGLSQVLEHSYEAFILPDGKDPDDSEDSLKQRLTTETNDDHNDNDGNREMDTYNGDYESDNCSSFDEIEPEVPFGCLPVDSIAERLSRD
ncbi:hypothetical protein BHE74_00042986 [Ensete ventricosum]|nr:hypothetical protein BHE74_00042986 [Ensete ventricosum]